MVENRYKQDAPGEEAGWKPRDVVVKGMVVPGGASGDTPSHAGGKESLEMIM